MSDKGTVYLASTRWGTRNQCPCGTCAPVSNNNVGVLTSVTRWFDENNGGACECFDPHNTCTGTVFFDCVMITGDRTLLKIKVPLDAAVWFGYVSLRGCLFDKNTVNQLDYLDSTQVQTLVDTTTVFQNPDDTDNQMYVVDVGFLLTIYPVNNAYRLVGCHNGADELFFRWFTVSQIVSATTGYTTEIHFNVQQRGSNVVGNVSYDVTTNYVIPIGGSTGRDTFRPVIPIGGTGTPSQITIDASVQVVTPPNPGTPLPVDDGNLACRIPVLLTCALLDMVTIGSSDTLTSWTGVGGLSGVSMTTYCGTPTLVLLEPGCDADLGMPGIDFSSLGTMLALNGPSPILANGSSLAWEFYLVFSVPAGTHQNAILYGDINSNAFYTSNNGIQNFCKLTTSGGQDQLVFNNGALTIQIAWIEVNNTTSNNTYWRCVCGFDWDPVGGNMHYYCNGLIDTQHVGTSPYYNFVTDGFGTNFIGVIHEVDLFSRTWALDNVKRNLNRLTDTWIVTDVNFGTPAQPTDVDQNAIFDRLGPLGAGTVYSVADEDMNGLHWGNAS